MFQPSSTRIALASLLLLPSMWGGCTCSRPQDDQNEPPPTSVVVVAAPSSADAAERGEPAMSAQPSAIKLPPPAATEAPPTLFPDTSDKPLHIETPTDLLSLFSIRQFSEKEIKRRGDPQIFLQKNVGPDGPSRANQGNKAIAGHQVSREQCRAGLAGVTIQTAEQKGICGAENMVPVYRKGDMSKAKTCIDVFEFPNKPCELPFVWTSPVQAKVLCEMQGKRLCSQEEWVMACRAAPDGSDDWLYSYGNELDLEACNTNKSARGTACDPDSAGSAWRTCSTNTEPSGSSPRCRSRLGVYDMQGNVAEIMTRLDADGHTYSQLKGSAWFYTDVARKHNERPKSGGRETYPDHCAHDPRWHVEPMESAWHVNYHLGFRCCKTVY